MPFSPITVGANSWTQSGPTGRYMLSTLSFGDPLNYFQVSGCSPVKGKPGTVAGGVTYVFEKDVTVNGITTRRRLTLQTIITADPGITAIEVDASLQSVSDWLTPATINRIMNGES